jgi:uncharacterized protein YciI
MRPSRRLFWVAVLIGVSAGPFETLGEQAHPPTAAQARQPAFVAIYERGSAWDDSKGVFEQTGINGHMQFLRANSDKLIGAGRFRQGTEPNATDRMVGMVVLLATTQEEAERLIANDPAVVGNVMRATVRQWLAERIRSY